MGIFERAIGGEDGAIDHEVTGEGSRAIPHEVTGRLTEAVRHEVVGQRDEVIRHQVTEVGELRLRPDPVVVRVEGFALRLRLFGREIARIEVGGTARVDAVGSQSEKFSK